MKESFKTILDNIKCDHLFISYNNEGLLGYDELKELLTSYGELKLYKIPYKKFKAQKNVVEDTVYEYLWYIHKNIVTNTNTNTNILIEEINYQL